MANQGQPPQWPANVVDRNNVHETVTTTMAHALLIVTPENTKRIQTYAKILWPQECNDPELYTKEWESRWCRFNGVQNRQQLDTKNRFHVNKTFVKLLIAEYKMHLQVNYDPTEQDKRKRSSTTPPPPDGGGGGDGGAGPSEPPRKLSRTSIVLVDAAPPKRAVRPPPVPVQAQQLADNLAIVAKNFQQAPGSPTRQQQRGSTGRIPMPTILRNTGDGQRPDYIGTPFKLADGNGYQDVVTDFQNLRQMLNALNPLLPQANPHEHPLYTIQGKMSIALELMKTKCSSIAAAYEHSNNVNTINNAWNPPQQATEDLVPRFGQMESRVMEAMKGIQAMIQEQPHHRHVVGGDGASASGGGGGGGDGGDSGDLLRECKRLREENQKNRQAFEMQRARTQELQRSLDKERQRVAKNVNLERLNHLQAAGFLVNDRIDPPAATLEAQDLIVMNKPNQYWSEFDQGRWDDLNDQQKKEMMCGWDPTEARTPHPAWASWDKVCPICSVIVGPEGGYSTGTCVSCIYHPGCLQSFLLSGTRLECARCGIPFNLRLWQAFKCTNIYMDLLPELGPDGQALPKRTPDMADDEFAQWHAKQERMVVAHKDIFRRVIPNRRRMDDEQFREAMNKLDVFVRKGAAGWGLVKSEWVDDVIANVKAICLPEAAGMPLFPEMIDETGYLNHPLWPDQFWRPGAPNP